MTTKILTGILLPKLKGRCYVSFWEALLMMAGRISREVRRHLRDNGTDCMGYMGCVERVEGDK